MAWSSFIPKPFDLTELITMIARHTARSAVQPDPLDSAPSR